MNVITILSTLTCCMCLGFTTSCYAQTSGKLDCKLLESIFKDKDVLRYFKLYYRLNKSNSNHIKIHFCNPGKYFKEWSYVHIGRKLYQVVDTTAYQKIPGIKINIKVVENDDYSLSIDLEDVSRGLACIMDIKQIKGKYVAIYKTGGMDVDSFPDD